jgi:uncharacterized membrane protein YraQ (UPF0718 family)
VPVAVDLRHRGASRGAVTAFLVSTPETGVDSIAASFSLLSPWLAIARPIVATISALVAGLLVEWGGRKAPADDLPACCDHVEEPTRGLRAGLRYAFVDLFEDVGLWLLPAILVSALLTATLEPGAAARYFSSPWLQMAVLLVVGIPVYVCATAATPLAAALIASGFSPGAALVFLLVGPATNLLTIVAAKKMLGTRGALLYVLAVAVTAVAGGVALDALFSDRGLGPAAATQPMHEHAGVLGDVSAGVLLALIARVWWAKLAKR